MTADEMIDLRMKSPFAPFDIHLSDGSVVHVPVAHVLAIGRKSPECVIYETADRIRFVPYRDIVSVSLEPANGSRPAG